MKKEILKSKKLYCVLSALIVFGFAACKKEHSNLVGGTGAPVITSVATAGKSKTDTLVTTVTTYDANGVATTVIDSNKTHNSVIPFDSTTTEGKKQNQYVIKGKNLGSVTGVSFNGVSAYFNPALVSDNTIIVSIPQNIPTGASVSNKLVVTTLHGSASFNFTVLTPPPTISKVSDYSFTAGSQITLSGVSFATVTSVGLKGSTATATIVSQVDTQMVIKMPTAAISRANLVFTYASGTATSTQEFIDLDNSYQIFVNNNYENGWFDNSWAHPSGISTTTSHSGTSSIEAFYPAGGWQVEGMADWNTPGKFAYNADYKYFTFWVKGGTVNHTLVLVGDQMVGGYGQVQNANAYAAQLISVPAKVWTFYKIPLGAPSSTNPNLLNFWANGTPAQQLGFFLQGQSGDVDEAIYFDEMAFVK
ncbi:hypothetical protein [Mucilaginibacter sp.]|uniref:hypothetical protein n=1 Tax=Mucilaginibacter sp. TaxID=1882438 RepID=UPI003D0EA75B